MAIVVLHWEDKSATKRCIASIAAAARQAGDQCTTSLLLVDNGSHIPFTPEDFGGFQPPQIELIRNKKNLGYTGGINVGLRAARAAGADAIWLLNNDTRLESNAISAMSSYLASHTEIACVGSVIMNDAGTKVTTIGGYTYQPWLSRAAPVGHKIAPAAVADAADDVDYICGSAIMLAPAYFRELSELPHRSFLYFEELYLNRAMEERGLISGVCTDVRVLHTQGVGTSRIGAAQRVYFSTLSALQYTRDYHPFFIPTVLIARLAQAGYLSLKSRQLSIVSNCLKAVICFFSREAVSTSNEGAHD